VRDPFESPVSQRRRVPGDREFTDSFDVRHALVQRTNQFAQVRDELLP